MGNQAGDLLVLYVNAALGIVALLRHFTHHAINYRGTLWESRAHVGEFVVCDYRGAGRRLCITAMFALRPQRERRQEAGLLWPAHRYWFRLGRGRRFGFLLQAVLQYLDTALNPSRPLMPRHTGFDANL